MPFVPAHLDITAPNAEPDRVALVLHGILGSAKNWRGFMRKLVRDVPDWRFVLVDLRNHGDSVGSQAPHTLEACADDLRRLTGDLGVEPAAVIGHSFGGKVALTYAQRHGAGLQQIWVLDATPEPRRTDDDALDDHQVVRVIRGLRDVPQPLEHREDVIEVLRGMGFSDMLARWMTTNLEGDDERGYTWRFDLDNVEAMLRDYLEADLWPFVEDPPPDLALHFVRAERSDGWSDDTVGRLRAAPDSVTLHRLADAGHWVHVDNPEGLADLLAGHLR